jgi:hypothetical protein
MVSLNDYLLSKVDLVAGGAVLRMSHLSSLYDLFTNATDLRSALEDLRREADTARRDENRLLVRALQKNVQQESISITSARSAVALLSIISNGILNWIEGQKVNGIVDLVSLLS